ncbi:UDP-N-acetylglucosamine--N-acetylmuramyl-(pentapeptide) pyrophosphoryl-undecaprenol N-acetylglucosamine transferase [Patescibacteria group bacterium]|nr:UDP-N-acetylglucosamine--N-acetylmuramyl-(pentapeptide) pyrophosphoryl-undecaprenol N-acetylglucosamine transferase [Patescibacteria group bacterium]
MKPKIFLSGGGTLGSVMPLLALWEKLRENYNCIWVGSRKGLERGFVEKKGIRYLAVPSGKIRRYFSVRNFFAPFFVFAGLKASLCHCLFFRPKAIVVMGSFVSVPLVWAGWILRIPVIVHQEDIDVGLAGKLTIPFARAVTTAFEETLQKIKHKNKHWVGNPVRNIFYSVNKNEAERKWKKGNRPVVLVSGGGLGSEKINRAVLNVARNINNECQIIDITGKDKKTIVNISNYRQIEQLDDEIAEVMEVADIVVSRAGLSTLSELSALGKPAILIPLKSVGQDKNARYFEKKAAAIVVDEDNLQNLDREIIELLENKEKRNKLAENIKKIFPPNAAKKMEEIVEKTAKQT